MRERFNRFMAGRYGADQLTKFLVISSLVLIVASRFIRLALLQFGAFGLLIFAYYRMFSRKIGDRVEENQIYMIKRNKVVSKFNKTKNKAKGIKDYKYFKCNNCNQEIRVPRKKGKIKIICPRCKNEMIKKT